MIYFDFMATMMRFSPEFHGRERHLHEMEPGIAETRVEKTVFPLS